MKRAEVYLFSYYVKIRLRPEICRDVTHCSFYPVEIYCQVFNHIILKITLKKIKNRVYYYESKLIYTISFKKTQDQFSNFCCIIFGCCPVASI